MERISSIILSIEKERVNLMEIYMHPLFQYLKTINQCRGCLQFKSESLDRPLFVAALSIFPSLIESLETLSQHKVCLHFKSESLDLLSLVAALSIFLSLIESLETFSQHRVCLQFKSELLYRLQLALPRVSFLQTKIWKDLCLTLVNAYHQLINQVLKRF
jgi:hypothetical protein